MYQHIPVAYTSAKLQCHCCSLHNQEYTVQAHRPVQQKNHHKIDTEHTRATQVGLPACEAFLDGFNAAVFAYGQTGSGKTHTMYGDLIAQDTDSEGLIPRTLRHVFSRLKALKERAASVSCTCTLVEIYNEQVIDLLGTEAFRSSTSSHVQACPRRDSGIPSGSGLQIREDSLRGTVFVEVSLLVCDGIDYAFVCTLFFFLKRTVYI